MKLKLHVYAIDGALSGSEILIQYYLAQAVRRGLFFGCIGTHTYDRKTTPLCNNTSQRSREFCNLILKYTVNDEQEKDSILC